MGRLWACARVRLNLDTVNDKLILFTPNCDMNLALRSYGCMTIKDVRRTERSLHHLRFMQTLAGPRLSSKECGSKECEPIQALGFWIQTNNFHMGNGEEFYVNFLSTIRISIMILKPDQDPQGVTTLAWLYLGPPPECKRSAPSHHPNTSL